MFLSSFALEITALAFLAEISISQSSLRHPNTVNMKFLSHTLLAKESLLPILISVAIPAVTVIILTLVGVLPQEAATTYFFFTLFLLQICILFRITYRAQAAPEIKRILLFGGILLGTVALLTLLSSLIAPLGAITGMGTWTPLTASLLPLSPLLYLILTVLTPFLHRTAK